MSMKTAAAHQGTVSMPVHILAVSPVSTNHLINTQVWTCLYHQTAKVTAQGLGYTLMQLFQMPSEYIPHPAVDGATGKIETGLGSMNLPG